jgi:hypothetical protein
METHETMEDAREAAFTLSYLEPHLIVRAGERFAVLTGAEADATGAEPVEYIADQLGYAGHFWAERRGTYATYPRVASVPPLVRGQRVAPPVRGQRRHAHGALHPLQQRQAAPKVQVGGGVALASGLPTHR